MFARIIYLTIRHYFVTLVALVVIYLIFVSYYHVNETLLFVLTILVSWLQQVIDKVREIKRQVQIDASPVPTRGEVKAPRINWTAIFGKVRRPLLIVIILLLAVFFVTYLYLFTRLRHWW